MEESWRTHTWLVVGVYAAIQCRWHRILATVLGVCMVNAFKVYSHHRSLQSGEEKPEDLTLMQFSMRVAKSLCDEGVESRRRSPPKRQRGPEAAAQEAPICKLVDFKVAQGQPELVMQQGRQLPNTTRPARRLRCSGCKRKTRLCCALHSSPENLVPLCDSISAGCLLRHACNHNAKIDSICGQFKIE